MIEITRGTLDEQIIRILQKTYPMTVEELKIKLHLSKQQVVRVLNKLHVKGIVRLEPLPDKTYIRLLRHDFSFVGKKRQRKFIKHSRSKINKSKDYDGIMYT
jgi:predicted ArsR family transcriptional regulator